MSRNVKLAATVLTGVAVGGACYRMFKPCKAAVTKPIFSNDILQSNPVSATPVVMPPVPMVDYVKGRQFGRVHYQLVVSPDAFTADEVQLMATQLVALADINDHMRQASLFNEAAKLRPDAFTQDYLREQLSTASGTFLMHLHACGVVDGFAPPLERYFSGSCKEGDFFVAEQDDAKVLAALVDYWKTLERPVDVHLRLFNTDEAYYCISAGVCDVLVSIDGMQATLQAGVDAEENVETLKQALEMQCYSVDQIEPSKPVC